MPLNDTLLPYQGAAAQGLQAEARPLMDGPEERAWLTEDDGFDFAGAFMTPAPETLITHAHALPFTVELLPGDAFAFVSPATPAGQAGWYAEAPAASGWSLPSGPAADPAILTPPDTGMLQADIFDDLTQPLLPDLTPLPFSPHTALGPDMLAGA
jgi:hypothetical protein